MFTQPKNCCCCIGVRTGTMVLAVLQILNGLGDIAYASHYGRPFANTQLYVGLFMIAAGIFGCYAVLKDSPRHVKHYKTIYWIMFFLQFISWGILYAIALIFAATTDNCYLYTTNNYDGEVRVNVNRGQPCRKNIGVLVGVFAALAVGYLVALILNLHFCFSIRAYYRNLLKAQAADTTNSNNATVSRNVQDPEATHV